MSSADYSLELKLNNETLKQQINEIRRAFGGSSSGGGGVQGGMAQAMDKVFGGLAKKGFTSIISMGLKLSGMAIMIDKIGKAMINASPMLTQILKLLDVGIMFMLRPIGDFIGFLLKPIVLFFFKNVAIPFYRYFTPFMQKYGNAIGTALTDPAIGIPALAGGLFAVYKGIQFMTGKMVNLTSDTIATGVTKGMNDYNSGKTPRPTPKAGASTKGTDLNDIGKAGSEDLGGATIKGTVVGAGGKVQVQINPRTGTATITNKGKPVYSVDNTGGLGEGGRAVTPSPTSSSTDSAYTAMKKVKASVSSSALNDAEKAIASRIAGGDWAFALRMAKAAGGALKLIIKNLPELGIIVAAATGDPSWIVMGYGGLAGGGEASSGSLDYSKPPPAFTSTPKGTGNQSSYPLTGQNGGTQINVTVANSLKDPSFVAALQGFVSQYLQKQNSRKPAG